MYATAAKSLQSCLILCDSIDGSPPGSPVPGILQARTLEWVAISFSNAWKWKVKVKSLSRVWLFATPWTAAYQAPPSMGFSSLVLYKFWFTADRRSNWPRQAFPSLREANPEGLTDLEVMGPSPADFEGYCYWCMLHSLCSTRTSCPCAHCLREQVWELMGAANTNSRQGGAESRHW